MRYYNHESAYQQLRQKGCKNWDEFVGAATDFSFFEAALDRASFASTSPLLLETGCGTGTISCFFAQKGFRVEGVDLSATAIAMAREHARNSGLEVGYRVADLCRDALPQKRYDLVVDGHFLHCIVAKEHRLDVLRNVRSALRPGGQFWIDTMIADSATNFGDHTVLDEQGILWVRVKTPGRFDMEKEIAGQTCMANRRVYHDPREIESELNMAGFVIDWSETVPPEKHGQCAVFRAICTAK